MATSAAITSALALHATLAGFSAIVPNEDVSDMMIQASTAALHSAIEVPAVSFSDVHAKLVAVIADAGCGFVEVDDLQLIARDLDTLLGRMQ